MQLYNRRSKLGLVGEEIDVETGQWVSRASHVGATHDAALAVNPAPMQMKPAAAAIAAGSPLEISG